MILHPFHLLVFTLAGWMSCRQRVEIEYLKEEIRVLRERIGGKRLRFTEVQRRRLAAKAKQVGREMLKKLTTLVTPDTLLRWYWKLIVQKYDGSEKRGPVVLEKSAGRRTSGVAGNCGLGVA